MAQDLEDLVGFLGDPREEVRTQAHQIVAQLSGTDDGLFALERQLDKLVPRLLSALAAGGPSSKDAAAALVNLTQKARPTAEAVRRGAANVVMDVLRDSDGVLDGVLVMLLTNLTTGRDGAEQLLQAANEKLQGLHLARIVHLFARGGAAEPEDYDLLANVLVNLTREPLGRELLVAETRGLVAPLLGELGSEREARRVGVANVLRNLAIAEESRAPLLARGGDKMLEGLLRPVSGRRPLELSSEVRQACAEALLQLATLEEGRDALWRLDAPNALKKGYEDEEHPGVMEALEQTARLFIENSLGDDADETPEQEVGCSMVPLGFQR